jgi:NADH-quinone oxidoreductase subunit J
VIFWVLAALALASAVGLLLASHPVRAALAFAANLGAIALLYLLLGAELLALVQIIVYAGAVVVLFLFVIMVVGADRREPFLETLKGQRPMAALVLLLLVAGVASALVTLGRAGFPAGPPGGVGELGSLLFSTYLLPFEATSVVFLAAAVAALTLSGKRRGE